MISFSGFLGKQLVMGLGGGEGNGWAIYGGFEQRQWLNGHDFWVMTKLGFASSWVSMVFEEDDPNREIKASGGYLKSGVI